MKKNQKLSGSSAKTCLHQDHKCCSRKVSRGKVTWSINTHLDDKDFIDSQRVTFGPGELEKEISFPLDQSPMKDKNGKYIFSASDLTGDAIYRTF